MRKIDWKERIEIESKKRKLKAKVERIESESRERKNVKFGSHREWKEELFTLGGSESDAETCDQL